jgi:hypothetical protein
VSEAVICQLRSLHSIESLSLPQILRPRASECRLAGIKIQESQ